jgi:hypothetical protein
MSAVTCLYVELSRTFRAVKYKPRNVPETVMSGLRNGL